MTRTLSPKRKALFAALTVLFVTAVALVGAELVLRFQQGAVGQSDDMDPGLIEYDRTFGWRLVRGWRGRHRHHDFDVSYTVGSHGFRGAPPRRREGTRVALVGDSFTYGIGVGDKSTFAHLLAREGGEVGGGEVEGREVLDFGVPGYSTDQELLLVEKKVLPTKPDVVVLVVCLINDVFDNPRPFPLQAEQAKPMFALEEGGRLVLDRVPVPRMPKPRGEGRADLERLVYGLDLERPTGLRAFFGRRELCRRLGLFQPRADPPPGYFDHRYDDALALFDALVLRMKNAVEARGARFVLALLPGRTFVTQPASYAHRYQDHLRELILETWQGRGVRVVDLATELEKGYAAGRGPWYHPNEGHLNAEGHREVAARLGAALDE